MGSGIGQRGAHVRLAIFLLGNISNRAVPFLLLPVLTRYLGPADYGNLGLFQAAFSLAVVLVGASLHGHVPRVHYARAQDLGDVPGLLGNIMLFLGASVSFWTLCLVVWLALGGWTSGLPGWVVIALPVSAAGRCILDVVGALLRCREKDLSFIAVEFLFTCAGVVLSLLLVCWAHWGWTGRAAGQMAAVLGAGSVALAYAHFSGSWRLTGDAGGRRALLRSGYPLVLNGLAGFCLNAADRFAVDHFAGKHDVGLYVLAVQLASVILIIGESINQFWLSWFNRLASLHDHEADLRIVRATVGYAMGLAGMTFGAALLAPVAIPLISTSAFAGAAVLVFPLAIAAAAQSLYKLMVHYLFLHGRSSLLGWWSPAMAVVSIGSMAFLGSQFGAIGVATGCAISWSLNLVCMFFIARRIRPMPWMEGIKTLVGVR